MHQRPRRSRPKLNRKLFGAFFLVIAALVAQDPTSYLTPDVTRVGDRLACRCGGCRNTVGNCPMLHCHSADPLRQRIYQMKAQGTSDDQIVNTIVREEGVVALSAPPSGELGGLIAWIMPAIALLLGFFIYSAYVRRNRRQPAPITAEDQEIINRYGSQLEVDPEDRSGTPDSRKK